jgi:hypothetical protein
VETNVDTGGAMSPSSSLWLLMSIISCCYS